MELRVANDDPLDNIKVELLPGVSRTIYKDSAANSIGLNAFDVGLYPLNENDDTTDQTTLLRAALTAAEGLGTTLFIPEGRYNYSGSLGNVSCNISGVPGKTIIHNIQSQGRNGRFDYVNEREISIYGLTFVTDNLPPNPTNNGGENDVIFRFTNGYNINISNCAFYNTYGAPVLIRHSENVLIADCYVESCWKDAFHITGWSKNITRRHNHVVNGGDDAFPVVGYLTGSGAGLPENIFDIGNRVNGVKFARAFAYVGAKNVVNIGSVVDGRIPDGFPQYDEFNASEGSNDDIFNGTYTTSAALKIASESNAQWSTYANENIVVDGFTASYCGSPSSGAIDISSRLSYLNKNIIIKDSHISYSAKQHVYSGRGGNSEKILIENCVFVSNTDPLNKITDNPENKNADAMEFANANEVILRNVLLDESGGGGIVIGANVVGRFEIDIATKNINKSGSGGKDILFINSSAKIVLSSEIRVLLQPGIFNVKTPYFLDRIIEWQGSAGKIHKNFIESSVGKFFVTQVPSGTITEPSPVTWSNDKPFPVLIYVSASTLIEKAVTKDIVSPVWYGLDKTLGISVLMPGESIRITYTGTPTLFWKPTIE